MIDKLLPYGYILNFGNKRIYDPTVIDNAS